MPLPLIKLSAMTATSNTPTRRCWRPPMFGELHCAPVRGMRGGHRNCKRTASHWLLRAGRAGLCGAEGQGETPLWAVGSKKSAACTRKAILTTHVHYSNKSRTTARLQELMLCLLGCLRFRADLGLVIRSGPFCPSCPSWDRSPFCKTTNNLLPTRTVINYRS
jgi:hypothetical protein